jgi:hypothetical protein
LTKAVEDKADSEVREVTETENERDREIAREKRKECERNKYHDRLEHADSSENECHTGTTEVSIRDAPEADNGVENEKDSRESLH